MGIFSGICSFVSSCCRAVGSFVSKVGSGIKKCVTSLSNFAKKALSSAVRFVANNALVIAQKVFKIGTAIFGPQVGLILGMLVYIALKNAATKLGKEENVIQEEEEVEELGYRIKEADAHADWKRREDFGSFREYMNYLSRQIPKDSIDRQKLKENNIEYGTIGISVIGQMISEKQEIDITPDFWLISARAKLTTAEMQAIIAALKKLGLSSTEKLKDLFEKKLPISEGKKLSEVLLNQMNEYAPKDVILDTAARLEDIRKASINESYLAEKVYNKELSAINDLAQKIEKENLKPNEESKIFTEDTIADIYNQINKGDKNNCG